MAGEEEDGQRSTPAHVMTGRHTKPAQSPMSLGLAVAVEPGPGHDPPRPTRSSKRLSLNAPLARKEAVRE